MALPSVAGNSSAKGGGSGSIEGVVVGRYWE